MEKSEFPERGLAWEGLGENSNSPKNPRPEPGVRKVLNPEGRRHQRLSSEPDNLQVDARCRHRNAKRVGGGHRQSVETLHDVDVLHDRRQKLGRASPDATVLQRDLSRRALKLRDDVWVGRVQYLVDQTVGNAGAYVDSGGAAAERRCEIRDDCANGKSSSQGVGSRRACRAVSSRRSRCAIDACWTRSA
jgi:hypothetical protein